MAENFYSDTRPKAEDNLEYGSKKYFKQSFKNYADIVEKGLKEGHGNLTQSDINILSKRFNDLKLFDFDGNDKDVASAKKQMKSIVKEYMLNKSIKSDGIDTSISRLKKKKFKDV